MTTRKLREDLEVEAGTMEIAWEAGEPPPIAAEKLRLDGAACSHGVEVTTAI
jgi:hypothetical protein